MEGAILKKLIKDSGLTQEEFGQKIGASRTTIIQLTQKFSIPKRWKEKISKELNVDTSIFNVNTLGSEGGDESVEIRKGSKVERIYREKVPQKGEVEESQIPVYGNMVRAGNAQLFDDISGKPIGFIRIPGFADCNFSTYVYGSSMYPKIVNGDLIIGRIVEDKRLIVPGEVYYVQTSEFRVCKRLQKSKLEGHVLAVSDNDEERKDGNRRYESFDIPIDAIISLVLVKGRMEKLLN